ncbi:FAD-binding protein [Egibacter rhizosphaerae]|uniref:FAD-binding protein n=1 Tax=Egibacter rhizosphaerae TaxID=1670831 RepID=A0A411YBD3_9ACTN|nr:FAD-binding protein [Egibacter rhizosphaerae]QBI18531.1 FAD-binding protein [Egibacter rhizosphaerae]
MTESPATPVERLPTSEDEVVEAVRELTARAACDVVGAGTLVGARTESDPAVSTRNLTGVVDHRPSDLVVRVRPGTPWRELDGVLADVGQECPIEGPATTVGGQVASGLTGLRRLGAGHLRNWVLGTRFVSAEGEIVRSGGGTVKNVTGYDVTRLLVGSWGTLGILTEITLTVRPRPAAARWYRVAGRLDAAARRELRTAASVLRDAGDTYVRLEGHPSDCDRDAERGGLLEAPAPEVPSAVRIAVPPPEVEAVVGQLTGRYLVEEGLGIIHADASATEVPTLTRLVRERSGRVLCLEAAGAEPLFAAFEGPRPLDAAVKQALDPVGVLAPWRFQR